MPWKYFTENEFRCPCCGMLRLDPTLVDLLDQAREKAGIPFRITSGYRCPNHNREVGGKPSSAHLAGKAADIKVNSSRERYFIVRALLEAGFQRVGIAKGFVHADVDLEKPHPVVWLY